MNANENDTLNMVPLITTRDPETNTTVWQAVAAACDKQYDIMFKYMRDLSDEGYAAYWTAFHHHSKLLTIREALTAELRGFYESDPFV